MFEAGERQAVMKSSLVIGAVEQAVEDAGCKGIPRADPVDYATKCDLLGLIGPVRRIHARRDPMAVRMVQVTYRGGNDPHVGVRRKCSFCGFTAAFLSITVKLLA